MKIFYPKAKQWMWSYCTYLGSYTSPYGNNYDLGIYIYKDCVSFAIVYGNNDGDYISGGDFNDQERYFSDDFKDMPWFAETIKLARIKKLI